MTTFRQFYVKSHANTSPDINFKDIPGTSGRMDILARCINSAFWLSYGIRKNVIFHTILHGKPHISTYLRFEGIKLKKIMPDERNIIIFIKKALERFDKQNEVESTPGVFIDSLSFDDFVNRHKTCTYYLLDESGVNISDVKLDSSAIFFMSDNIDFEAHEKKLLLEMESIPISLGSISYLSSHCICILNWLLDGQETL
jgi:tRNA (pseudouridine54-N1)-methyltransferase